MPLPLTRSLPALGKDLYPHPLKKARIEKIICIHNGNNTVKHINKEHCLSNAISKPVWVSLIFSPPHLFPLLAQLNAEQRNTAKNFKCVILAA